MLLLGLCDPSFPSRQKIVQLGADRLLEHLPDVFWGHVEALPDLALLHSILDHLLMVLAALIEVDLVGIQVAVLTDLPKGDSSDGVVADVELPTRVDALTHLDHGSLLCRSDLAPSADPKEHVFGHRDRDELDFVLEEVIQLPDHVLPIAEGNVAELANVELLKVVLHLEASGEDGVDGNIFD